MKLTQKKIIGNLGEEIAAKFLESKGFRIVERNYRKPWGEVDIIAEKAGVLRFVEVKAVSRENPASISREMADYRPEEQVHPAKLRRVINTAALYMAHKEDDREYQIDVVGVFLDMNTRKARCRLFEQVL